MTWRAEKLCLGRNMAEGGGNAGRGKKGNKQGKEGGNENSYAQQGKDMMLVTAIRAKEGSRLAKCQRIPSRETQGCSVSYLLRASTTIGGRQWKALNWWGVGGLARGRLGTSKVHCFTRGSGCNRLDPQEYFN